MDRPRFFESSAQPAEGAATRGEGVIVLSAAPAVGRVPGSGAFAERYTKRFGPIANYAVNSYDAARLVLLAVDRAASTKGALPARADVIGALRSLRYQGIAYARPVEWVAKGDNMAAVIFLNIVEGDRFKEVGEITRDGVLSRAGPEARPIGPSRSWLRIARIQANVSRQLQY